jgi:thioesterase domain-containing protein
VTVEEKLDRVADNLDRLVGVVNSLASSVVAHDNQLETLIQLAEKHDAAIANLERQWQAYINTLPRQ